MEFLIENLTTRVEQLFKSLILLFFGVHYGLIPVLSRTTALLMLVTSIIMLSVIRFRYYSTLLQRTSHTQEESTTKLAIVDSLLILTFGIGFTSIASYSVFNSQLVVPVGLFLSLLGLFFFGLKRHYLAHSPLTADPTVVQS